MEAVIAGALFLVVFGGVFALWMGGLAASSDHAAVVSLAGEAHRATADLALALRNAAPTGLTFVRRGQSFTHPTSGAVSLAASDMVFGVAEVLPGATGEPLRLGADGREGRTLWVLAHDGALVRRRLGPGGVIEDEATLVHTLAPEEDAFRLEVVESRVEIEVRTQAGSGEGRPRRVSRTATVLRSAAGMAP